MATAASDFYPDDGSILVEEAVFTANEFALGNSMVFPFQAADVVINPSLLLQQATYSGDDGPEWPATFTHTGITHELGLGNFDPGGEDEGPSGFTSRFYIVWPYAGGGNRANIWTEFLLRFRWTGGETIELRGGGEEEEPEGFNLADPTTWFRSDLYEVGTGIPNCALEMIWPDLTRQGWGWLGTTDAFQSTNGAQGCIPGTYAYQGQWTKVRRERGLVSF